MKNKLYLICLISLAIIITNENAQAQSNVAINTSGIPDASSILDVNSTSLGLLIPRLSTNPLAAASPANGLIFYNTTSNTLNTNTGSASTPNFVSLINGSATAPLTYNTANGFAITQANTSTNGYLLSTDWGIFNAKQTLLNNTASSAIPGFVKFTGTSPSYDNTATYCSSFGITNFLPKYTGTYAIANSLIYDNGTNIGIATTSPNSTLQINGSFSAAVFPVAQGTSKTLDGTNFTILGQTANGNKDVTLTLPTAIGIIGRKYNIKNTSGSGATNGGSVFVGTVGTQTIDGVSYSSTKYTLLGTSSVTIQSDGANWFIIGRYL